MKNKKYELKDVFPIKNCYYLKDIDENILDIFWQNLDIEDSRIKKFEKQYNKYGFDERETWSLYYVISIFIYTRLKLFIDCCNIDFNDEYEKKI